MIRSHWKRSRALRLSSVILASGGVSEFLVDSGAASLADLKKILGILLIATSAAYAIRAVFNVRAPPVDPSETSPRLRIRPTRAKVLVALTLLTLGVLDLVSSEPVVEVIVLSIVLSPAIALRA